MMYNAVGKIGVIAGISRRKSIQPVNITVIQAKQCGNKYGIMNFNIRCTSSFCRINNLVRDQITAFSYFACPILNEPVCKAPKIATHSR